MREVRHWLVVNVNQSIGNDSGDALTPYRGPGPPASTGMLCKYYRILNVVIFSGLHRYVLLVYRFVNIHYICCIVHYRQNGSITDPTITDANRTNWSVAQFAIRNQLIGPIAGNYFQSQNANQSELQTSTMSVSTTTIGDSTTTISDSTTTTSASAFINHRILYYPIFMFVILQIITKQ